MCNVDEYLMLSGIQHFSFCRRQWALIHIEQQWLEDGSTAAGHVEHERCHDSTIFEKRGNLITVRGLRVNSHELRLSGECDAVEFHASSEGIHINYADGKWLPFPIEYKHGHKKVNNADRLQLCAQAIALEEMLVCSIRQGAVYYFETRQREIVVFDDDLRNEVKQISAEMWNYFVKGHTPKAKTGNHCKYCSMYPICLPPLNHRKKVKLYIDKALEE